MLVPLPLVRFTMTGPRLSCLVVFNIMFLLQSISSREAFPSFSHFVHRTSSLSRSRKLPLPHRCASVPVSSRQQQQTPESVVTNVSPVIAPSKFVPFPFSYRQELDIVVETLTNRGMGLGRVVLTPEQIKGLEEVNADRTKPSPMNDEFNDESRATNGEKNKWVVMVPSVIPGELVRVRVFRNFRGYSEADLVQVLEASGDRIDPVCPLANECGGCQLQHMEIGSQRKWKTAHVKDALAQYKIELDEALVKPCLGTDHIYGYRSKLTPHYNEPTKSRRGQQNLANNSIVKEIQAIGFQKQSSRQVIDVAECPIATPAVNEAYGNIRKQLLSNPPKGKKGATLLLRQGNLDDSYVETNHRNDLTTTVGGLDFTYKAGNFFQNNYHVLPLMVDSVVSEATMGGQMTHLADCYCGSGLFALSCAQHFDRVVGIEINEKAITEATANAQANQIHNCEFLAASAENIFSVISDFPRNSTTVLLDPPRKGCSETFLKQLVDYDPARIVYMSCDPTTQARDAAFLVQHNYTIASVQPFDLFPQTRHIECLMILEHS